MKSHEMVFDPEDPRLSAYALGELGEEESNQVERLVATDSRAAAFVEELRTTAGLVEREFALEVARASKREPSATPSSLSVPPAKARPSRILLRAAGLIAIVGGTAYLLDQLVFHRVGHEPDRRVELAEAQVAASKPADSAGEAGYAQNPSGLLQTMIPTPFQRQSSVGYASEAKLGMASVQSTVTSGGAGKRKAPASAGISPAPDIQQDVYYDDGEDGDFRATKRDELAELEVEDFNTEGYNPIVENAFKLAAQDPLSTFSIDVDTASYANVRRFLTQGTLPPADAVRIEELVNYFRFAYPAPQGNAPFSSTATVGSCPWSVTHKLVQVGLRARDIDMAKRQSSNLVFLVDVSGSMDEPDKLPLLVRSMRLLVQELDARDRIALVVYAGASGVVLPSTACDMKAAILRALDSLQAGGSTNGAAGIELAYDIAIQNRLSEGQNRVILCTDGDFNVGVTDQGSLVKLIEEKRKSGVFLSVLGFGTGNVKDSTMEMLADKGNGNYAYIDSIAEARKVLVSEMGGTLFAVAKDVKIQVEFNPTLVQAWRLIGYENRQLAHQDFNDDTKDAGEIGAGHTVTALYEIVPVGVKHEASDVDALRYQQPAGTSPAAFTDELMMLKLRYKTPEGETSTLSSTPVKDSNASWTEAESDFRFAAAVAAFGMVLRKSENVGGFTLQDVVNLAAPEVGDDVGGYRREFVEMVRAAQGVMGKGKVR